MIFLSLGRDLVNPNPVNLTLKLSWEDQQITTAIFQKKTFYLITLILYTLFIYRCVKSHIFLLLKLKRNIVLIKNKSFGEDEEGANIMDSPLHAIIIKLASLSLQIKTIGSLSSKAHIYKSHTEGRSRRQFAVPHPDWFGGDLLFTL